MTFAQRVSKAAPPPALQAWLLRGSSRAGFALRLGRARLRRVRAEHPAFDLHMAWLVSVVFIAGLTVLIPVRAAGGVGDALQRLMQLSGGDLSDKGFKRAFAMDPAAAWVAYRLYPERARPEPGQPNPAALVPSTQDMPGLSADQARSINAAIPFSLDPSPAARPFVMPVTDLIDQSRAIDCLTAAVYYEAASEPLAGQQAVAQVVLNRMRHPGFPKTICGVVFEGADLSTGCQFTFTCDGSLARAPQADAWQRARRVASAALGGFVVHSVGDATHYHADYVVPYWATTMVKISKVGSQIFYRWTGGWGAPAAFSGRYAGVEPVVDLTASTAQAPLDPTLTPPPPLPLPITVAKAPAVVVSAATVTPISTDTPQPMTASTHRFAITLPWQTQASASKAPASKSQPEGARPALPKPAAVSPAKPVAPSTPETIAAGPLWERH